jgi:hypothetical protein
MRTTNTRYLEALATLAHPVMVGTRRVPGLKLEGDQ